MHKLIFDDWDDR